MTETATATRTAYLWLVEEHTDDPYDGETASFHAVVTSDTAQEAFLAAQRAATAEGDRSGFLFGAGELTEAVPGYLWVAADGSSIGYEVRRLGPAGLTVTVRRPAPAPGVHGDVLDEFRVPFHVTGVVLVQDEMAFVNEHGQEVAATDIA